MAGVNSMKCEVLTLENSGTGPSLPVDGEKWWA